MTDVPLRLFSAGFDRV